MVDRIILGCFCHLQELLLRFAFHCDLRPGIVFPLNNRAFVEILANLIGSDDSLRDQLGRQACRQSLEISPWVSPHDNDHLVLIPRSAGQLTSEQRDSAEVYASKH